MSDVRKTIIELTGEAGRLTRAKDRVLGTTNCYVGLKTKDVGVFDTSSFFRPFDSITRGSIDFCFKASSIVVAPICFSFAALIAVLDAGSFLLKSIGDLLKGDFDEAKKDIKQCGNFMFFVPAVMLITALLSPLINLIDLIGSTINSINQAVDLDQSNTKFQPV